MHVMSYGPVSCMNGGKKEAPEVSVGSKMMQHILDFNGGATLWPGWSQDHLDLEKKIIYNNLKFYIYLPLKKNLGPP